MHCERRARRERGRRAFAIEAITILSDADYLSRGTSVAKIKVVCLNQSINQSIKTAYAHAPGSKAHRMERECPLCLNSPEKSQPEFDRFKTELWGVGKRDAIRWIC